MEEKLAQNSVKPNDISLKEIIVKLIEWYRYLLSKWMLIIAFVIIGGIFGFTYAYFKIPIYTATTTFVLEEDKGGGGGLGSLAGLASMAGVDIGGGGGVFQGDNILALYKSRSMIERTLLTSINGGQEMLIDHYVTFNKLRDKWKKDSRLKNIQFSILKTSGNIPSKFTRVQDSIIGTIVTDINTNYLDVSKPDKKLNIIKADVKSPDEFFAKTFNNEIVKNVNDFYVQTKTKKSLANVAILQQKVDSVRSAMNGSIYIAAAAIDATPNLNLTRQIQRSSPVQRAQFSAETNKAILGELVKNLELSKISLRREAPLIQVIDEPVFPLDITQIGKIKGVFIGGFLMGALTVILLIIKKIIKEI